MAARAAPVLSLLETAAPGEHVTRPPRQAIAGPTEDRTIGKRDDPLAAIGARWS